ncbi:MAG: hypothetical protein IJM59_10750 [Proteobacteria bacterium]|nr:hypothetical protein [Pseudomonadota bacterium]
MNDIFSAKRFFKLLLIDLQTNAVSLGIGIGILIGFILGLNILTYNIVETPEFKALWFVIILVIAFMLAPFITNLMASHSFSAFQKRETATPLMMLPCSKLEKFTSRYLIYIILLPLISILGLYAAELYFGHLCLSELTEKYPDLQMIIKDGFRPVIFLSLMLSLMVSQSMFLLGSVIFKKSPFILTILAVFGIFIVFSILAMVVPDVTDALKSAFDFSRLSEDDSSLLSLVPPAIMIVIFSFAAWMRFSRMSLP